MIVAPPRSSSPRFASRHFATQFNAPLGSLEPLLRLRGAEGHQAQRALSLRIATLRSSAHRFALRGFSAQRNST
jgi:hypothetical protein